MSFTEILLRKLFLFDASVCDLEISFLISDEVSVRDKNRILERVLCDGDLRDI